MKLLNTKTGLNGELTVPADKSISHRSIMFGAISHGKTTVHNFLRAEDCLSTIALFKALGVTINDDGKEITVEGKGIEHLQAPKDLLDAGNSGTTMRLVLGILAGRPFHSEIAGDASLNRRPMERVMGPLRAMGETCKAKKEVNFLLLKLTANNYQRSPMKCRSPVLKSNRRFFLPHYRQKV